MGNRKREKEARQRLAKEKGIVVVRNGIAGGNLHMDADWEAAPTTTLKHGLIARLTGQPPKEVR